VAFELKKRERVSRGVRRVVCNRIDRALSTLKNTDHHPAGDEAVHDARKRFKQIRGTLRLVRDELGEKTFARENRVYRDAGRPLSMVRDAKVLVDSLDKLLDHFHGRIKAGKFAWLRRALVNRRKTVRKQTLGRDHAVDRIVKALRSAQARVDDWPLRRRGWKAIENGLRDAYAKGRRAMKRAMKTPSDDALHEWRKRTKDLRYQLELVAGVSRKALAPLAERAKRLTDLLGDDHDLCVLGLIVHEQKRAKRSQLDVELLDALIAERRAALQKEGHRVGEKLYDRRPRDFVRHVKDCWKAGRRGEAKAQRK
jgi:CHAD domain-containing protein